MRWTAGRAENSNDEIFWGIDETEDDAPCHAHAISIWRWNRSLADSVSDGAFNTQLWRISMLKTLTRVAISVAFSAAGINYGYAATPAQVASSGKRKILVDENGMSLYTFAKDSKGKAA